MAGEMMPHFVDAKPDHISYREWATISPFHDKPVPPKPIWEVQVQGRTVRFRRTGMAKPPMKERKRGAVGPWSQQSRMNLLRVLNRIEYEKLPAGHFVTLTYPDEFWSVEYTRRTDHRNAFHQSLEREVGKRLPCIWRIEWEERKSGAYTGNLAPHFHLMVFGCGRLEKSDVRPLWRRAIGREKGPCVVDVKAIWGVDGACRYLSKYVSKYRALDICTYVNSGIRFGRHWGLRRDDLIPWSPVKLFRQLTDKEIARVQAFAADRWSWYDKELNGGYTLFGDDYVKRFHDLLSTD